LELTQRESGIAPDEVVTVAGTHAADHVAHGVRLALKATKVAANDARAKDPKIDRVLGKDIAEDQIRFAAPAALQPSY
jgi:hypothetical protein